MNKDKELELRKSIYINDQKKGKNHKRSSSCYGKPLNLQDYLPSEAVKKTKLKSNQNKTSKNTTKKKSNKCRLCYL